MNFGYNDVVYGQPQLRDDKSCALDVLDIQYCESGDKFENSDYLMQPLLHRIKRAKNNEYSHSTEVIPAGNFEKLRI